MDNNMDFGFSSNPDNGNKERQNRFIFSDDYYDSIASSEFRFNKMFSCLEVLFTLCAMLLYA